jgi:uncharacterized protein YeaO (DUF488 family)
MREFRVRRLYEVPNPEDGVRLLVDRLWPRGVSKEAAKMCGSKLADGFSARPEHGC